jgi:four helix bundle protein
VATDLKDRTKKFAVDVIRFCSRLPREQEFRVIGNQLIRCASSVGANYRSASRAKSKLDFIAKLGIVEEEADEACYWLELIEGLGMTEAKETVALKAEANQLVAIVVASKKTARANLTANAVRELPTVRRS